MLRKIAAAVSWQQYPQVRLLFSSLHQPEFRVKTKKRRCFKKESKYWDKYVLYTHCPKGCPEQFYVSQHTLMQYIGMECIYMICRRGFVGAFIYTDTHTHMHTQKWKDWQEMLNASQVVSFRRSGGKGFPCQNNPSSRLHHAGAHLNAFRFEFLQLCPTLEPLGNIWRVKSADALFSRQICQA